LSLGVTAPHSTATAPRPPQPPALLALLRYSALARFGAAHESAAQRAPGRRPSQRAPDERTGQHVFTGRGSVSQNQACHPLPSEPVPTV